MATFCSFLNAIIIIIIIIIIIRRVGLCIEYRVYRVKNEFDSGCAYEQHKHFLYLTRLFPMQTLRFSDVFRG